MLTEEDDVEIHALAARGWKVSQIARHTGRDRKTVAKYLNGEGGGQHRAPAASCLEPFRGDIEARFVDDPHLDATVLHRELAEAGLDHSYPTLVRELRRLELRPVCLVCEHHRGQAVTVEIDHPAGEEIQWDWLELHDTPWGQPAFRAAGRAVALRALQGRLLRADDLRASGRGDAPRARRPGRLSALVPRSRGAAAGRGSRFGEHALVHRCHRHKERNVTDLLPERDRDQVRARMRASWALTDAELAEQRLQLLAGELDRTWPDAAGSLREGMADTLTLMRLRITGKLATTLSSTNPCESMIEIVRYTQRNVKRWQDGDMRKRWTAAGMLVAEQQFRRIIGYRDLAKLVIAVERHAILVAPTKSDHPEGAETVTVWSSTGDRRRNSTTMRTTSASSQRARSRIDRSPAKSRFAITRGVSSHRSPSSGRVPKLRPQMIRYVDPAHESDALPEHSSFGRIEVRPPARPVPVPVAVDEQLLVAAQNRPRGRQVSKQKS